MNTDNTKPLSVNDLPLYKVLNEKRTCKEWVADNTQITTGFEPADETIFDGQPQGEYPAAWERNINEAKANAQYTALCVNNLESVADALMAMVKIFEKEYKEGTIGHRYICQAKEALALIS